MPQEIYIDSVNGNDLTGSGSMLNPYNSLDHFCNTVANKDNADYIIYLNGGTYPIKTSTIFGQFKSGQITILGKGKDTTISQDTGMYMNSVGGYKEFTVNIGRCIYNIAKNLYTNVNCFKWYWNFYNVVFKSLPLSEGYSLLSPYQSVLTINNCLVIEEPYNMLRTDSGQIHVKNSAGKFSSGYSTIQSNWDISGNLIEKITVDEHFRVTNHESEFLYSGTYNWSSAFFFVLDNGKYKKYENNQWVIFKWTLPTAEEFKTSGMRVDEIAMLDKVNGVSPFDSLEGDTFEIVTTSESALSPKTNITINKENLDKLVIANDDINLRSVDRIQSFNLKVLNDKDSSIKVIVSFDKGLTWYTYDKTTLTWETIELTKSIVSNKGINVSTFNTISSTEWDKVRDISNNMRFAYYIKGSNVVDNLDFTVNLKGIWKRAIAGTHYDYGYPNNDELLVSLFADGSYKINY